MWRVTALTMIVTNMEISEHFNNGIKKRWKYVEAEIAP
jgi:hypothetical protein